MTIHKIVSMSVMSDKITNHVSFPIPSNLLPKSSHCQNRAMLLYPVTSCKQAALGSHLIQIPRHYYGPYWYQVCKCNVTVKLK